LVQEFLDSVADERDDADDCLEDALNNLDIYLGFPDELLSLVDRICEAHKLRTGEDEQLCKEDRKQLGEMIRDVWLFHTSVAPVDGGFGVTITIPDSDPPQVRNSQTERLKRALLK
jgi:hypothetical protein